MKRIRVYMYPCSHAGVALYSYKLANALVEKGVETTTFVDDCYELDTLPARFKKAQVLCSKYEGIRLNKSFPWRVGGIIGSHVYNSRKFYGYVKKDAPEVVHLHSFLFYPLEWTLLLRLKRTPARIVLTVHNVLPYRYYLWPFVGLERTILEYVYQCADRLIVHSEANKSQLLSEFSIERNKVVVIPHGEYSFGQRKNAITQDEARRRLGIKANEIVVLFFGYIRRIKGIDILLEAFDKVAARYPNAVLIIAGSVIEGQSFDEYARRLKSLKHAGRIKCFIKYVPYEDIPLFFVSADIVVAPYREFSGQSGVALLGAGFGKAMIVSDAGGLPEVVEHGKTGLVVPAGGVDSLAEAMALLLKDSDLREAMGRQAELKAMEDFSWGKIATETIEKAYL
jgi:D-inositol-3-phosphate glycosyltransferase